MARSMTSQVAQIQKETTPGTAVTAAMKRLMGVRLTPAYNVDGTQENKASGYKVNTSVQIGDVWSTWNVEGIQDFNAIGFILASIFGPPVTTAVEDTTGAYEHVFAPNAAAVDALVTYTAQWGDSVQALQAAYLAFQGLTLGIERGNLSFSSSAISRKVAAQTLASAGVTTVPSVPIPSRGYNVFADDTWAGLGDTKLLAAYSGNITNGDKFTPDRPINSAIDGYESLMESDDIEYSGSLTLGFDAVGTAFLSTFDNEAIKYLRFAVDGPIIEGTTPYSLTYDIAARLTNVGELTTAPNSPAVSLPFDFLMVPDPVTGKYQQVTLVNTIASY